LGFPPANPIGARRRRADDPRQTHNPDWRSNAPGALRNIKERPQGISSATALAAA
jgi:hypothetical protein